MQHKLKVVDAMIRVFALNCCVSFLEHCATIPAQHNLLCLKESVALALVQALVSQLKSCFKLCCWSALIVKVRREHIASILTLH